MALEQMRKRHGVSDEIHQEVLGEITSAIVMRA